MVGPEILSHHRQAFLMAPLGFVGLDGVSGVCGSSLEEKRPGMGAAGVAGQSSLIWSKGTDGTGTLAQWPWTIILLEL